MKISTALQIIQRADAAAPPYRVILACGFTPLHLQTFLSAHLQQALPGKKVELTTGLYGDLPGTLRKAAAAAADAVTVAVEWPDLDPRLGYRNLGGWGPQLESDILAQVKSALDQLIALAHGAAQSKPLAVSFPTLPLPPAFHTPAGQMGGIEAALQAALYEAAAEMADERNIRIVNPRLLEEESPAAGRFDLKSDLLTGLPYSLAHASAMGQTIAALLAPPAPKKGLITDLDDTLWNGILGEAGVDGISWDLASHTQLHGLYQQLLRALADQGVLIAIASKNDPDLVQKALARADLILPPNRIFPVEVHWHAKSNSAARILRQWNIGADAVVFVDDSPMELAEVQTAFPEMAGLVFPKNDYPAAEVFLRRLRGMFGKPELSAEDQIRRESLRQAARFQDQLADADASDDFLRTLEARIGVNKQAAADPRSLELINKTNQFNLNGRRFEPAEWQSHWLQDGGFVWSVAYEDKFGPLGKIAVIGGFCRNGSLEIDSWVMSCRAFARRIEHQCLHLLFTESAAREISFRFQSTDRNGPLQDFLRGLLGEPLGPDARLDRLAFEQHCPPLFHTITGVNP